MVRALDPDDLAATRRTASADPQWRDLETLLGTRFYRRVGVLTAWRAEDGVQEATATIARRTNSFVSRDRMMDGSPFPVSLSETTYWPLRCRGQRKRRRGAENTC